MYLSLNYLQQKDLEGALVGVRRANQVQEAAMQGGDVGNFAFNIWDTLTEQPDTRSWQTLLAQQTTLVWIARQGAHATV